MTVDDFTEAIRSVLCYNGYQEIVKSWIDNDNDWIHCPDDYGVLSGDQESKAQLQIIWMIGVLLFGNYGTSPRFGWIEDIEEFKEWILRITKHGEWFDCETGEYVEAEDDC